MWREISQTERGKVCFDFGVQEHMTKHRTHGSTGRKMQVKKPKAYRQAHDLSPPLLNTLDSFILAVCFTYRDCPLPELAHCRSLTPLLISELLVPSLSLAALQFSPPGATFSSSKSPPLVPSPLCATGDYSLFSSSPAWPKLVNTQTVPTMNRPANR